MINNDAACSTESQEDILMEVQDRVREETAVDVADQGRIRFSVWVSFAEIYNEQIFDLLEPMPRKNNARRPVLKLSEDRRGSPYIKGDIPTLYSLCRSYTNLWNLSRLKPKLGLVCILILYVHVKDYCDGFVPFSLIIDCETAH